MRSRGDGLVDARGSARTGAKGRPLHLRHTAVGHPGLPQARSPSCLRTVDHRLQRFQPLFAHGFLEDDVGGPRQDRLIGEGAAISLTYVSAHRSANCGKRGDGLAIGLLQGDHTMKTNVLIDALGWTAVLFQTLDNASDVTAAPAVPVETRDPIRCLNTHKDYDTD